MKKAGVITIFLMLIFSVENYNVIAQNIDNDISAENPKEEIQNYFNLAKENLFTFLSVPTYGCCCAVLLSLPFYHTHETSNISSAKKMGPELKRIGAMLIFSHFFSKCTESRK